MTADDYAAQAAHMETQAQIARGRGWHDLAAEFEALAERTKIWGHEAQQ